MNIRKNYQRLAYTNPDWFRCRVCPHLKQFSQQTAKRFKRFQNQVVKFYGQSH